MHQRGRRASQALSLGKAFPFGRVAKETAGRLRRPQLAPMVVDGGGVRLTALYGPMTPTEPRLLWECYHDELRTGVSWILRESLPRHQVDTAISQSVRGSRTHFGRRGVTPTLGRRRRGRSTIGTHDRPIYHRQARPTRLAFANRTAGRGPPRGLPHLARRAMRPIAGLVSVDEWLLVAAFGVILAIVIFHAALP